jgi:hypothetical protein
VRTRCNLLVTGVESYSWSAPQKSKIVKLDRGFRPQGRRFIPGSCVAQLRSACWPLFDHGQPERYS